jgi:hypothetical protein
MTTCIKPLVTYTCSNASGTTCTKVAATVYIPSANTACAAGEFAVLLQTEKTQFDGDRPLITALQTATGTLTTQTNGLTTTTNGLTTTTNGLTSTTNSLTTATNGLLAGDTTQAADIATLKGQMQLIAAGSSILGTQPPNPQIIQAEAVIFGLALAAACAVWGMKKVYQIFIPHYESERDHG